MGKLFDDVTGPTAIPPDCYALDADNTKIRVGDIVQRVARAASSNMIEGNHYIVREVEGPRVWVEGVTGPWRACFFRRVGGDHGTTV